jgi:hypothetical protein
MHVMLVQMDINFLAKDYACLIAELAIALFVKLLLLVGVVIRIFH